MEGSEGSAVGGDSAATSSGTDSSMADTSVDTGSDSTESGDSGGESAGEAAAKAEARFKVSRMGKEAEYTPAEMAKMLSDDYEWDFHGQLGKPLIGKDGKPVKKTWRQIARDVQMSHGAAEAARRHNEEVKRIQQISEWAKAKTPDGDYQNLEAFLSDHLGVEDFETFALRRAAKAFDRRRQLTELAQKDPVSYEREYRRDLEQRDQRIKEAQSRMQQRQQQAAEQQQRQQRWEAQLGEQLKGAGLPMNSRTKEIAEQIVADYVEAGADLPWEDLAHLVRDAWHEEMFGYIDKHPDDQLLKLLGDKRRERLRAAEVAALKVQKQAAKQQEPAPRPAATNGANKNGNGKKPLTADQWMRAQRNGGRF